MQRQVHHTHTPSSLQQLLLQHSRNARTPMHLLLLLA
jgi:hypothetical protein